MWYSSSICMTCFVFDLQTYEHFSETVLDAAKKCKDDELFWGKQNNKVIYFAFPLICITFVCSFYMQEQKRHTINVGGRLTDFSSPLVMGILNVTPDSFYASSRVQTEEAIARRADQIVAEGGTMIDVGAFSTRPGGQAVSEEEEMARLRLALGVVRRCQPDAVVSVDTFRPDVARMVVEEFGAAIINDVSEGGVAEFGGVHITQDEDGVPAMFLMVARLRVPYILMSVRHDIPSMLKAFAAEVQTLHALGVADVILDPGFGFGKTLEENYQVMAGLDRLHVLGLPVLVGVSRKSMIYKLLGCDADATLNATTALHAVALMKGADILRVHDVAEAVEVVKTIQALQFPNSPQKQHTSKLPNS